MTGRILNPVRWEDIESGLTEAEKQLAECLAQGNPCVLGDAVPKAEESGHHNTVRPEVIRFFAYGGDGENSVRGAVIALRGAWICGDEPLDLTHADIPYALEFSRCHFAVGVNMRHAKCEALYLNGSRLTQGLTADGLKTKGNVHLRDRFFAGGEVRLGGADIGGPLDCTGGKFHNPKGYALNADGLTTKGDVNLRDGFSADGEVWLLGADIGRNLDCAGGEFHNQGGDALTVDGLTAKGGVFLRNGFSAEGEVCLSGADIGRDLDCTGGRFHNPNPKKCALNAEHAKIGGGLFWWGMEEGEGVVNLAYAKAGVLADDLDSWKPFKVILDGFAYDQFAGLTSPTDAKPRIEWLANRPSKLPDGIPLPLSPLPYEQAAKVLRAMGKDIDAWDILREKRRLEREERDSSNAPKVPLWRRLWGRTIDTLTNFVYRPWKTLGWAVSIVLAGAILFDFADENGRMVPHQPAALASVKYQYGRIPSETPGETVARKFPGYPGFNPLLFSADIFVPLLNLHQEPFWYPAPDGGRPSWWRAPKGEGFSLWFLLEWWYWFQIAAGAVLTSMFLLSVTGLLRPRQSSGEKG